MGPAAILILIVSLGVNLLVYGTQNRNIASKSNNNISSAFWLGLLGPIGMIICLVNSGSTSWKKFLFGALRLFLWAIIAQIFVEIEVISEANITILHYLVGWPFILRGKYIFNFSVAKS